MRELVKAGALIAAEIDRLLRAEHEPAGGEPTEARKGAGDVEVDDLIADGEPELTEQEGS